MPEKEGAEEKSTKSVVNKKQKQMMGEEGYDIARDMGRVPKTKDKKDASSYPVSKEVRNMKGDTPMQKEFKKKYGKKATALDAVKQKYKSQIMNVGKKKANEELDLTKVAEAFGGYIVEAKVTGSTPEEEELKKKKDQTSKEIQQKSITNQERAEQSRRRTQGAGGQKNIGSGKGAERVTGDGSKRQKQTKTKQEILKKIYDTKTGVRDRVASGDDKMASPKDAKKLNITKREKTDPITNIELGAQSKKGIEARKKIEQETGRRTLEPTPASGTGLPTDADDATIGVAPGEKEAPVYSFRQGTEREGPVAKFQRLKREKAEAEAKKAAKKKAEKSAAASERNRNRKLVGSGSREVSPETQKKIDAVTPPFATKQGETGPLPVSMRNRRVPKTSSLSPNVKVTSIVKPKVGALARTDQETSAITKGQIDYKALQDRVRTVTPDQVISPKGDPLKVNQPKEGPTIDITPERETQTQTGRRTRTGTPTKTDIKKLKPPKIAGYIAPPDETPVGTPPEEPIEPPIGGGKGGGKKKTKVGNFSYRPGGAFSRILGFTRKNPALSLIGYDALRNLQAPRVEKPTRTGRVSAGT